jgi:hypothetical protein
MRAARSTCSRSIQHVAATTSGEKRRQFSATRSNAGRHAIGPRGVSSLYSPKSAGSALSRA